MATLLTLDCLYDHRQDNEVSSAQIINHHPFIFHQQNPYLQHEKAIVIPFHRLDCV